MNTATCNKCGKEFKTNKSEDSEHVCYDCALDSITHGRPPEEGDFNSASIMSGRMSDAEFREFQRELRMVETGSSTFTGFDDGDQEEEDDFSPDWSATDEDDQDAW